MDDDLAASQPGQGPREIADELYGQMRRAKLVVKAAPFGVHILPGEAVPRWFSDQPEILSQKHCELIYEWARRSATWR